jgi:LPXTG-site transpeptidase (sortase) family protein
MPDPVGYFNAVWYDFSGWPGLGGYVNAGNVVLSGHVDCARCYSGGSGTAVFWSVRNLKVGDTAQYRTADGRTFNYVVTSSRSVSPGADFSTIVAAGTADMTLITCTGSFSGGEYSLRHVVSFRKT